MARHQHNGMNPRCPVIEALEPRTMFDAVAVGGHVTDAQAEVLARVVAYESTLSVGSTPLAGSDYVVNHVFNDTHDGFAAVGLISPTVAPVLVLRGTDDSKDVTADANRTGVGFNQFSDNWLGKKGVKAWLDSAPVTNSEILGAVDLVGHSLGGALAQWIAAAYTHAGHDVGRVVTFNAPGISASYARRFNATRAISVIDYITSDDIVSMGGQAYISGQYDLVHYNSESELAPNLTAIFSWELTKHTTPVLTDAAGGTVPADEMIDAPAPTSQLGSKTFEFSDAEYSDMLGDLKTAISVFPSYRKLPAALTSRATTEAVRPSLFKILFSQLGGSAL